MWNDGRRGKSFLTPASSSKLSSSISNVFTNWLESLPQELVFKVLFSLPMKSLIILTSVCKSWNSYIKNPSFINTHLIRTLNSTDQNAPHHLILIHSVQCEDYSDDDDEGRHRIREFTQDSYSLRYDNSALSEYRRVVFPVDLNKDLINPCFRVVETCNGLVLLADNLGDYGDTLVLWNPSVRKYVILPKPSVEISGKYEACLGYDADRNDYKVVRVTTPSEDLGMPTSAQVYSLAEGAWGVSSCVANCRVRGVSDWNGQVFVNGVLHWLAEHWTAEENEEKNAACFILTYDVAGASFGEMMLPELFNSEEPKEMTLCVSGDRTSVALFVGDENLHFWVKTEYSVEDSWAKVAVLNRQGPESSPLKAICFHKRGEVIMELDNSHELVSHDVVTKEFKHLGIYGGLICTVDSYEETLVLLDGENAISY